ncbi:hypothetical protein PSN45_004306 [Yamadazyma tenuis]|uniref:Uncharacterized protein n=1 Tax=Candida tenuis (strain ATCC 10573 / BCRC 21748 / CBS 615 / JCM 9827 / NBRC 10315 / NRRL Y-1498 / VKM Y-70) TaxID=590646 RepID=G3B691_CANTC|nr:uncharacterized protein CANTEDRAFT_94168 [Yamadazyma tenuis ATCC 10573]EGV63416.1 hypothetical protein CANTEDRAFT_94168 [Yamadazyma tenuis ATCC 10573]WEJ96763.1 hypothetical protein PSN45_004306 [Yamadazyma tenuis]
MASYTKVSRSSLYESGDELQDNPTYIPDLNLEIIEVEHTEDLKEEQPEDEFDFPLFSFGSAPSSQNHSVGDSQKRGRTETKIMKVNLREESVETLRSERPSSYYFAQYTEEQRANFHLVAVTGEDIWSRVELATSTNDWYRHRILDADVHNANISPERPSRKRPGKNKRDGRIESKKRQAEARRVHRENERRLLKKKMHKRGGKKNKKAAKPVS